MYEVVVKIETVAPVLFRQPLEAEKEAVRTSTRRSITAADRIKEAEKLIYKDDTGVYAPSRWIEASLRTGLKGLRVNKKTLYEKNIKATIFVPQPKIYFTRKGKIIKEKDGMDTQPGKNWNAKGALIMVSRPYLDMGVELEFKIVCTWDFLTKDVLHQGLINAGLLAGIGSGSPKYGRYFVKKFDK